jgi:hypothetical protein
MQTIPVNPQLANKATHHVAPTLHAPLPPLPQVKPEVGSRPSFDADPAAKQATAAHQRIEANPYAELDAMLIRDPNIGAVHGLRTALLFNAGLVLSGLVVWELWSLLAS